MLQNFTFGGKKWGILVKVLINIKKKKYNVVLLFLDNRAKI